MILINSIFVSGGWPPTIPDPTPISRRERKHPIGTAYVRIHPHRRIDQKLHEAT